MMQQVTKTAREITKHSEQIENIKDTSGSENSEDDEDGDDDDVIGPLPPPELGNTQVHVCIKLKVL